ncbi:MAG: hypothetical protein FIA90_08330, partial [candidate division NC10 bacterium]|nr:hypothetical protein [candidate division NC10 bacterium]
MATDSMPESVSIRRESNRGDRSPETPVLTHPKSHEVLGILGIALALYLLASLLSYDALDPSFFSSGGGPEHQVRNYGGRWGAELVGDRRIILRALVLVADQEADRGAGGPALVDAREDFHRVALAPLRDVARTAGL